VEEEGKKREWRSCDRSGTLKDSGEVALQPPVLAQRARSGCTRWTRAVGGHKATSRKAGKPFHPRQYRIHDRPVGRGR